MSFCKCFALRIPFEKGEDLLIVHSFRIKLFVISICRRDWLNYDISQQIRCCPFTFANLFTSHQKVIPAINEAEDLAMTVR